MRLALLTAAALLVAAPAALAAPASVDVSLSPEMQKKFDKTYGQREAALLSADLKASVEKALAKTGAHDGARIQLTITGATPNRPTFKQLGDTPGLSMESFGIGGAAIEGQVIAADGKMTPISYRWFETDIRQAKGNWVWSDAEWTFDRFAHKLARGQELAER